MYGQEKTHAPLRQSRRGGRNSTPPPGVQRIFKPVVIRQMLNAAYAAPLAQRPGGGIQHQRGQGAPFMQPTNSNGSTEGAGDGRIHQAGGRLTVQQPNRQQSAHLDFDMVAVHGPATNQQLGEKFDFNRCTQCTTKLICGVSSAPQIYREPLCGVSSAPQSGVLGQSVVHPVQHTYYSHVLPHSFSQNHCCPAGHHKDKSIKTKQPKNWSQLNPDQQKTKSNPAAANPNWSKP